MKIGILGTGKVAQTLGGCLLELKHQVVFGTRNVSTTLARTEPDSYGQPPFSEWLKQHLDAKVGTFAEAARHGDAVINATHGMSSLEALKQAGESNFNGKILIDVANPLDFSKGMPPSLSVCNTDSLAEQIQRLLPEAKVVKTLNTVTADLMVNPRQLADGDHVLFVSGNDAGAKAQVSKWLTTWFGWKTVIDLGDITSARGAEMMLPIWLRLMMSSGGSGLFNINVVRQKK
jgi:8-hydroxy-5-deazaflavin:NADPH oxidoreductase